MIVTVFDTETSGLPTRPSQFKRYADPFTETSRYDSARMVELAYVTYLVSDEKGESPKLIDQRSTLVRPDDTFTITNDDIHGIPHAFAKKHGRPLRDVLVDFVSAVERSDVVVSHNIEFDQNIVGAEMVRANMIQTARTFMSPETRFVCTMKLAMETFSLTRFPTLKHLYEITHPSSQRWTQTHRAMDDALRAADCYLDLIKRV